MKDRIQIIPCDFNNPDHLFALVGLINKHIDQRDDISERISEIQQLRMVDSLNNQPNGLILLAEVNGEAVGFANGYESYDILSAGKYLQIHDIIIRDDFIESNVERALKEAMKEIAALRKYKAKMLTLSVEL